MTVRLKLYNQPFTVVIFTNDPEKKGVGHICSYRIIRCIDTQLLEMNLRALKRCGKRDRGNLSFRVSNIGGPANTFQTNHSTSNICSRHSGSTCTHSTKSFIG